MPQINKKIKKLLTNTVFVLISALNKVWPKKDQIILLYSNMGFRDNIEYLYRYIISNHYNDKYKILRSQNEKFEGELPSNVSIISNVAAIIWFLRAGHVFYCFGKLPIYPSKKQIVIQMWHGTPYKAPDEWQLENRTRKSYYTYVLSSSEYMKTAVEKVHGVGDAQIAICGQPRTDVMFDYGGKYRELKKYAKIIIWMPTFRTSSVLGYSNTDQETGLIPLFDANDYAKLNSVLQEYNFCLIVKLHPLQDADDFNKDYSHLWLLTDSEFKSRKWDLYKLLGQSDALVTDYSSVFYDFMLLDRPMAFTVEDYEDYKSNRGFVVDEPDYLTAGYKLKTQSDFYCFIGDLAQNIDRFAAARQEVNAKVNAYNDGKQCKRVLEISKIFK